MSSSSIISITSTSSSRASSRSPSPGPLPDPALKRGFEPAFLCPPPPPREAATQTPARPPALCPCCRRETAPWNEDGGFHCNCCGQLVACNRGRCREQMEEDLYNPEVRCPLCCERATFSWQAGGASRVRCDLAQRYPRSLGVFLSSRYAVYDLVK